MHVEGSTAWVLWEPALSPVLCNLTVGLIARLTQEMERELRQKGKTEESAQVDRYKQLLLKQRDIMIALTARLNERDEQILTLQVSPRTVP